MLKFGNKEFRNLQEQVLKNMQNIANIKEGTAVLSEFGIKVVGEVDSIQDLPTVADYKTAHEDWEYGDAFAIGTEAPYTLVILTRANDEITADHWFDIGDFPAPGPQGERGPQGEQGPQGQTGNTGPAGNDAGFGSVLATAQTLSAGSSATATVTASGPNTAKEFSFVFGIPRGADGGSPVWGNIQGTLSDQTDLKNALDAKQDTLVSGTNIKTINSQSVVGSGNIEINSGVWGNITGTLSNQTDLKNALDAKQDVIDSSHKLPASNVSGLATVATTGSYDDLSNKPTIPAAQVNSDWSAVSGVAQILNKPSLATVATSGSYNDLTDKPSIPAAQVQSDYTQSNSSAVDYIKNKPDLSIYAQSANLATVATSGSYTDLIDKPSIPAAQVQSDYAQSDNTQVDYIKNKPDLSVYALSSSLATVATSGDYDDLTDKPDLTIYAESSDLGTAAYIDEDALSIAASQVSGLATVATSGDYDDLLNKPTIGDATLTIQKNGTIVDTFTANATSDKTINITVPTSSDYVDLTSAQTITGVKTFSGNWPVKIDGPNDYDLQLSQLGVKITYDNDAYTTYQKNKITKGGTGITEYDINLPTTAGTLALTSDLTNYVTTNTAQTITGVKTFNNNFTINLESDPSVGSDPDTETEVFKVHDVGDNIDLIRCVSLDADGENNVTVNANNFKWGTRTVATLNDVPTNYVTTNTSQTITGTKTFSSAVNVNNTLNITNNGGTPLAIEYDPTDSSAIRIKEENGSGYTYLRISGAATITFPAATGTVALTSDIPSVPVTDVTVGGTSVVSSGTAVIPGSLPVEVLTTEPSAAYTGPGLKVVYLSAEPTTKYAGYIYMIAEA